MKKHLILTVDPTNKSSVKELEDKLNENYKIISSNTINTGVRYYNQYSFTNEVIVIYQLSL